MFIFGILCFITSRIRIAFHHDNARPHVEQRVVNSIEEKGWELLEHPPYSPTEGCADNYASTQ